MFFYRSAWVASALVLLGLLLADKVPAQTVPLSSGAGSSRYDMVGSDQCQAHWKAADFKAGLFYGGGRISVDHNIPAGPGQLDTQTVFDTFSHRRETRLDDAYAAFQWGLRRGESDVLLLNLETNLGRITRFKQTTAPGTGLGSLITGGRATLAILWLPDNTEGEISLDNRNRVWTWDILGLAPVASGLDVLFGYKCTRITSNLDPYATDIASAVFPNPLFVFLPGLTNWQNNYAVQTTGGGPSRLSFSITQSFRYQGPILGARLKNTMAAPRAGAWHVDFLMAPFLWGGYEFTWSGIHTEPGGAFARGIQRTNATGLKRFYLEVRGASQFALRDSLSFDVTGRFAYLSMTGSAPEVQFGEANVFVPADTGTQSVTQTIRMSQYFWGIGGDLVLWF
jgi:hypothetical protein